MSAIQTSCDSLVGLREADEQTVADADLADDATVDADFGAGDALEEDSHGEEVYDVQGSSRNPNERAGVRVHYPLWSSTVMDETLALLIGLLGTTFVILGFLAALAGAWLLGRHSRGRMGAGESESVADLGARKMAEVMSRIDELTLELERTAEGQRYLAKMLSSEQNDALSRAKELMRPPERVVTPH